MEVGTGFLILRDKKSNLYDISAEVQYWFLRNVMEEFLTRLKS